MKYILLTLLFIISGFANEGITTLDKQSLYQNSRKKPLTAGLYALAPTMGHLYVDQWKRINPVSSLIISPIISIILLSPKNTLKEERTFISNALIPPKVVWYFLQIQDAIYLAHLHNSNLYKDIYGEESKHNFKKSVMQKLLDIKENKQ